MKLERGRLIQRIVVLIMLCGVMLGGDALFWGPATVSAAAVSVADPETIHVVQRGDTLYSIARRYGCTVKVLMDYNGLTSTTIYVGQQLAIPTNNPPGPAPTIYVVQRGDTLYSIARRHGMTVDGLMRLNHLTSTRIYVGQQLRVTGSNVPDPQPPQPTIYVVQRGDTLYSIARRHGTTVDVIMRLNALTSTRIYVGQRLRVPGPAHGTPPPAMTPTPTPIATATPTPRPTTVPGGTVYIDSLQVRILESYPVQVQAVIRGNLADACTRIDEVRQSRQGSLFHLNLVVSRPPDQMCAQVLTPFEQVVPLDVRGLAPGNYEARVQTVGATFTLP